MGFLRMERSVFTRLKTLLPASLPANTANNPNLRRGIQKIPLGGAHRARTNFDIPPPHFPLLTPPPILPCTKPLRFHYPTPSVPDICPR